MKLAWKGCLHVGALLFIFLILLSVDLYWILEFPFYLVAGWLLYLWRTLPEISWNWEALASGLVFLVLSVGGFHWIARSLAAGKSVTWQWRWSVCISGLMLLVFGVSLAVGGIAHQVAWLARAERWIGRSPESAVTRQIANAREVAIFVRLFAADEGGRYPARLEELLTADYMPGLDDFEKITTFSGPPNQPSCPWIYIRGLSEQAQSDLPVVIAPHAQANGKRIIASVDGNVELMKPEDIRKALPGWKAGYATLGIPLPSVLAEYDR